MNKLELVTEIKKLLYFIPDVLSDLIVKYLRFSVCTLQDMKMSANIHSGNECIGVLNNSLYYKYYYTNTIVVINTDTFKLSYKNIIIQKIYEHHMLVNKLIEYKNNVYILEHNKNIFRINLTSHKIKKIYKSTCDIWNIQIVNDNIYLLIDYNVKHCIKILNINFKYKSIIEFDYIYNIYVFDNEFYFSNLDYEIYKIIDNTHHYATTLKSYTMLKNCLILDDDLITNNFNTDNILIYQNYSENNEIFNEFKDNVSFHNFKYYDGYIYTFYNSEVKKYKIIYCNV